MPSRHHRPCNRPRAIAIAAPAPYSGPGHIVVIAALAAMLLLMFSHFSKAHAGFSGDPAEVQAQAGNSKPSLAQVSNGQARF